MKEGLFKALILKLSVANGSFVLLVAVAVFRGVSKYPNELPISQVIPLVLANEKVQVAALMLFIFLNALLLGFWFFQDRKG